MANRFERLLVVLVLGLAQAPCFAADGARVFEANCKSCHEAPADKRNGAPQRGDTEDWKERVAVGRAELYKRAIEGWQGYFTMPAKGGHPELADDDVKAAVDYLVGLP
jgi:cytochrome c5